MEEKADDIGNNIEISVENKNDTGQLSQTTTEQGEEHSTQGNHLIKEEPIVSMQSDQMKLSQSPSLSLPMSSTTHDPSLLFQNKLQNIISTQESILQITLTAKEKLHSTNEITQEQINTFKQNTKKYGIYLSLIKNELQTISEILKKIKKVKK